MLVDNFDKVFEKAENILNIWMGRGLSLHGGILVFNALVYSLFVYKLNVLPKINKNRIQEYNRLARKFVWGGKHPKIALEILQGNKSEGGLGLSNLEKRDTALKTQWIFKLRENPAVAHLASISLENKIGNWIWQLQLNIKDRHQLIEENDF